MLDDLVNATNSVYQELSLSVRLHTAPSQLAQIAIFSQLYMVLRDHLLTLRDLYALLRHSVIIILSQPFIGTKPPIYLNNAESVRQKWVKELEMNFLGDLSVPGIMDDQAAVTTITEDTNPQHNPPKQQPQQQVKQKATKQRQ